MFVHSLMSRRKIIHSADCVYLSKTPVDFISSYDTSQEAYACGYRMCRHCSVIARKYRNEKGAISDMSHDFGLSIVLKNNYIGIASPYSNWMIVPSEDNMYTLLYHKNTRVMPRDGESRIPGYHLQSVHRDSVSDYLEYIKKHDDFKMRHPDLRIDNKSKQNVPKEFTPQYKKYQNDMKKKKRRRAIAHVLDLIDSLQLDNKRAALGFAAV